jgi:hypothetical protein
LVVEEVRSRAYCREQFCKIPPHGFEGVAAVGDEPPPVFGIAGEVYLVYDYTSINGERFKVSVIIILVSIRIRAGLRIIWRCNRGTPLL